jgi:hypothetical protein
MIYIQTTSVKDAVKEYLEFSAACPRFDLYI